MDGLAPELKVMVPCTSWSRRGFVMTSLITGFALSAGSVSAETITTETNGLTAGEVKVPVKDGEIPAYRAMPDKGGPFPTVLVIQEVFGVHEHIKDSCRRLAKVGYFAIAPELYARQGDPSKYTDIPKLISEIVIKVPTDQVMSDLDAAVAYAKASGKADTTKLAVTGFCWGGFATWMYAAHNPVLKAAVAWYGSDRKITELTPKNPVDSQMPGARLLWRPGPEHSKRSHRGAAGSLHQGGQDLRIQDLPRCAARLQRRLPTDLPSRGRQRRLGPHARFVQAARRRLISSL
jgi:carboxymethylenebutenolidase